MRWFIDILRRVTPVGLRRNDRHGTELESEIRRLKAELRAAAALNERQGQRLKHLERIWELGAAETRCSAPRCG
jgi:hypothetical protein